jgi:hypothetical protein
MSTPKLPNDDDQKLKSKALKQEFKKKLDRIGCDKKGRKEQINNYQN